MGPVTMRTAVRDEDVPAVSIFGPQHRSTTAGLLTIITMLAFEAMAVGPALPTAARDLHWLGAYGWRSPRRSRPVVGMVLCGQISDVRGPRLPLLGGIAAFLAGLVVAGTAGSMAQLVLARGRAGHRGGLTITAAYVVIGESYDPQLRPKVFAATASAWVLPSLLGPVASGLLTEHVGWRWVFLGLVPFVLVGSALLWPVLQRLDRPAVAVPADDRRLLRALAVAAGVSGIEAAGQTRLDAGADRRRSPACCCWPGASSGWCRPAPSAPSRASPRRWRCAAWSPARSSASRPRCR